jgi:hypothetical protein
MTRIKRGMTKGHDSAFPRHVSPPSIASSNSLERRGDRECRVFCAPAASREAKNTRVSHHRSAETFRHSLRDGFTAYSGLSPETGL